MKKILFVVVSIIVSLIFLFGFVVSAMLVVSTNLQNAVNSVIVNDFIAKATYLILFCIYFIIMLISGVGIINLLNKFHKYLGFGGFFL